MFRQLNDFVCTVEYTYTDRIILLPILLYRNRKHSNEGKFNSETAIK